MLCNVSAVETLSLWNNTSYLTGNLSTRQVSFPFCARVTLSDQLENPEGEAMTREAMPMMEVHGSGEVLLSRMPTGSKVQPK